MSRPRWRIRFSDQSKQDFADVLAWTARQFGARQAAVYGETILAAVEALGGGPDVPGTVRRDDLWLGVRTIHVARQGRRGRHVVAYRAIGANTIEVIRILHDAMD